MYKLTNKQMRYLVLKRFLDIFVSSIATVILFIPMTLIIIILKILYPNLPAIFTQNRVGQDGRIFSIIKFTSMYRQDHFDSKNISQEEKVTKFGYFLRSSGLDELPQLFLVLSGKMSLIGPRPLMLKEKDIHIKRWEMGIYVLRPGITGWAQINGRDALSNELKVTLDKEYLENISLELDLRIFITTIKQGLWKR